MANKDLEQIKRNIGFFAAYIIKNTKQEKERFVLQQYEKGLFSSIPGENMTEEFEIVYKEQFKKIELDYMGNIDSTLIGFLYNEVPYFKEDFFIAEDDKSQEDLKKQKEFLKSILENLDKIGVLDELIKNENDNIKMINSLLTNKIPYFSKESLTKMVEDLDVTKPEDVIKMLIMSRNFSNKLAHNYNIFAIANIYMNTIGDKEFGAKVKYENKADEEMKREIEDKTKFISTLYKEAREEIGEKRREAMEQCIAEGNYEEADKLKKGKNIDLKKLGCDIAIAFVKEYKPYLLNRGSVYGLLFGNKVSSDDEIKSNIKGKMSEIKRKEQKRKIEEDKTEYCVNIYKEVELLQKAYVELDKNTNRGGRKESFYDFVKRVLANQKGDNEYSELNTQIEGKDDNIGKRLEALLNRVREEGIIRNPDNVILSITKKAEIVQQLYSCKHLFTKILVNASQKYPEILLCENDPVIEKTNGKRTDGVIDIYLRGAMQVFGGHYKAHEPECNDSEIQSLPRVDERINNAYTDINPKTRDSYLATYIPIFDLTKEQIEEFKDLRELINKTKTTVIKGVRKGERNIKIATGKYQKIDTVYDGEIPKTIKEGIIMNLRGKKPQFVKALELRLDLSLEEGKFKTRNDVSLSKPQGIEHEVAIPTETLHQNSVENAINNLGFMGNLSYQDITQERIEIRDDKQQSDEDEKV